MIGEERGVAFYVGVEVVCGCGLGLAGGAAAVVERWVALSESCWACGGGFDFEVLVLLLPVIGLRGLELVFLVHTGSSWIISNDRWGGSDGIDSGNLRKLFVNCLEVDCLRSSKSYSQEGRDEC